jgi:phage FluMu protein Com
MIRIRCARCGSFLARVEAHSGQRFEFPKCGRCQHWPMAVVDQDGVIHELAFRTRQAQETAQLLAVTG